MWDIIGALLSLSATLAFIVLSWWAWPMSLLASVVNAGLYAHHHLLGDTVLELLYAGIAIVGIYRWRFSDSPRLKRTSRLSSQAVWLVALSAVLGFFLIYISLIKIGVAKLPFWDAGTTIGSLIAEWLTVQKKIACWVWWFVVDMIYAAIYWNQGLPAHTIVLMSYLVLAVLGYRRWQRVVQEE